MASTTTREPSELDLIAQVDDAVQLGDVPRITHRVKSALEHYCTGRSSAWAVSLGQCCEDRYARRLMHRDEGLGYTIVAMTWGPGQGTELHDHAGIWCVECVLAGELEVTQYDLVEQDADRYRFEQRRMFLAGVGTAGCLIPPFEYHTLANALADRPTITLHVYGGEMNFCNLYEPTERGWWRQVPRSLEYAN